MKIRLNKYLAQAGLASRREADRWIQEGRVKVNNLVVQELGVKIDPGKDTVEVEGRKVRPAGEYVYILLNKPAGCLVTQKDPFKRPTIRNHLPPLRERVFPVGRLDFDTEGLLLLTNDGELAFRLTHPRYEVGKTYLVRVKGEPEPGTIRKLERGIILEGRKTAPGRIALVQSGPGKSLLRMEIHEGRKREIRRMWEVVGHPVLHLIRIGFACLKLERLESGKWRFLKPGEVKKLKSLVGL